MEAHSNRVFGLDCLRALAIASVVLAHASLANNLADTTAHLVPAVAPYIGWFGLLWHGGFVGVELFFVLSGYLIGRILLRTIAQTAQGPSLFLFYCRRWFRTLPLFWLFVALNVVFEASLHHRGIGLGEALGHAFFLRNFASISLTFMPESWSLAVEEWFYLLFPAALWLALRVMRGAVDWAFLLCAAAFFLLAVVTRTLGATHPGAAWEGAQRCVVLYRFDALMMGVLAAWISVRQPAAWRRHARAAAWLGGALFVACYANLWHFSRGGVASAPESFFAETFRFDFFSLSFALLLPLASRWTPTRETRWHGGVRKIALWSYALYLIHWPLFQIADIPLFKAWAGTWDTAAALFLVKVAVAVGLSAAFFYLYESPCTRLREKIPFLLGTAAAPGPASVADRPPAS